MLGSKTSDLQAALQLVLDWGVIMGNEEVAQRELCGAFKRERTEQTFDNAACKPVSRFQEELSQGGKGDLHEWTSKDLNRLLDESNGSDKQRPKLVVWGIVRFSDDLPMAGIKVLHVFTTPEAYGNCSNRWQTNRGRNSNKSNICF